MIQLKGEIGDLKIALVETGVEVGPAIYIARTFDTDVDTVVKFFILVLIFVFDPMAVIFVISYNVTLLERSSELPKQAKVVRKSKRKWWEVYGEKKDDLEEEVKTIIDKEKPETTDIEEKEIGRGGVSGK